MTTGPPTSQTANENPERHQEHTGYRCCGQIREPIVRSQNNGCHADRKGDEAPQPRKHENSARGYTHRKCNPSQGR